MTLKSSLVIYFYWIGLFCWSQTFTEAFNDIGDLNDWYFLNNSETPNLNWEQGNTLNINAFSGDPNSFIGVGYESSNAAEPATISNWAVSPSRTFNNGDILTFYSKRKEFTPVFPDRLEVRFSGSGNSIHTGFSPEDVGDFTSVLLSINPNLTSSGYPDIWTQYTVVISGLAAPTNGRIAFRYYVTDAGPNGSNSNYIGIDSFTYYSSLPSAVNDDCETASILNHDGSCVPETGSLIVANPSFPACDGTANNDVWYQFVANTNAASIEVIGSAELDAVLEIFSGSCSNLNSLNCVNTSYDGGTEATTLSNLIIGNTYFIRIYDWHNWIPNTMDFSICLQAFEQCSITPGINSSIEDEVCGSESNGGCYSAQQEYQDVSCYESVYGSSWVENGLKDYDWYRFDINEAGTYNIGVQSEFPITLELFDIQNCNIPQLLQASGFNSCEQGLFSGYIPVGTYALAVKATSDIPLSCFGLNHYEINFNLPLSNVTLNVASDSLIFCDGSSFYLSSNQNEGIFSWFLNNENISNTDSVMIDASGIAFLSYTNTNGCSSNYSDTVTVLFNDINDASFNYGNNILCIGDSIIECDNLEEGIYSAETGLSIDINNGAINTNESALGIYNIVHQTFGACPDTAETVITIGNYQELLMELPSIICDTANSFTMFAEPEGGIFSGTGVQQNIFEPSISGLGSHTISYTFDNSGCVSDISQEIIVENCAALYDNEFDIEVWPNPFYTELNLRLPLQTRYKIFTLNGKILHEGVSIHELAHIRGLNHLNYGMYLLQLSYNEKIITLPIIKH